MSNDSIIEENAKRYLKLLKNYKSRGYLLYFKTGFNEYNREVILRVPFRNKEYLGFDYQRENIIEETERFTNRTLSPNEVYYHIDVVLDGMILSYVIIPNLEMECLLSHIDGSDIFERVKYVDRVGFNLDLFESRPVSVHKSPIRWYHGSKSKLSNISNFNFRLSNINNDFSRGFYSTPNVKIAQLYKASKGNLIELSWYNEDLDNIYANVYRLNRNANDYKTQYRESLIGKHGERFIVKIYVRGSQDWANAIYDGRIIGKRQDNCDMVLAPISHVYLDSILEKYQERYNSIKFTYKELQKERKAFYHNIFTDIDNETNSNSPLVMGDVFQLCIYNSEVLKSFNYKII